MKRTHTLIVASSVLAVIALAGCGSTSDGASGTPAAGATMFTGSPSGAASPSCADRAVSWRDGGGKTEVDAVATDLGNIRTAGSSLGTAMGDGSDMTGPESRLQSASASLQTDAQAAEADPPPSCITGMRTAYMRAMTDYVKAAAGYQNSVSELTSGSDEVALGDIKAANAATLAGSIKLEKATTALRRFENG